MACLASLAGLAGLVALAALAGLPALLGLLASLPCLPQVPSLRLPLQRNAQDKYPGAASLPSQATRLPPLIEELKTTYKAFHAGKFAEAQALFDGLL